MMNFKLTLSIVIIILVIVFAGWYLYANYNPNGQDSRQDANSGIDSTAAIESDLNQVPDDSAINGDMNSLYASVQAF